MSCLTKKLLMLIVGWVMVCGIITNGWGDYSYSFVVMADSQNGPVNKGVLTTLIGNIPDSSELVIFPGDLVKDGLERSNMSLEKELNTEWKNCWNSNPWNESTDNLWGKRVFPGPGNHEIDCHNESKRIWYNVFRQVYTESNYTNNLRNLNKAFTGKGDPTQRDNLSYSFDYYPDPNIGSHSHFIILDVYGWDNDNNRYTRNLPLDWLKTDLRNSTSANHVFVFGHEPAYPVGHMKNGSVWWDGSLDRIPEERNRFWTLLEISDVDAYFAGHEHLYSHFDPVPDNPDDPNDSYNPPVDEPNDPNDTLPQGRVHQIITGGAGGDLWRQNTDFHHYVLVNVDGDNITGQARDTNNGIVHEFTFTSKRIPRPDNRKTLIAGPSSNPLWKIKIDPYGHSDWLEYRYPSGEKINEMYNWVGSVHYRKGTNIEPVHYWLNDTLTFNPDKSKWLDSNNNSGDYNAFYNTYKNSWDWYDETNETMANGQDPPGVISKIESNDLLVTIWSRVFPWSLPDGTQKYGLIQSYKFRNKLNVPLNDFKYIHYMDPDIMDEDKKNDWGVTPAYDILRPEGYPGAGVWILDKENAWRGYSLTCPFYFPQPDAYYLEYYPAAAQTYGKDKLKGHDVGNWYTIKQRVEEDNLQGNPDGLIIATGDIAGALRWSVYYDAGQLKPLSLAPKGTYGDSLTISPGMYVVPEPCTLLLMGTGIAGLAGIARRRRNRHHA